VGLKVTNTLHHLSIRRGIEVLRLNNFNPACLKRRPSPDEVQVSFKIFYMFKSENFGFKWLCMKLLYSHFTVG
jgi:hypothetical protein